MALFGRNGLQDDVFLIGEFRRGKPDAFKYIFQQYHGAVCYFAREFVKDNEVAKDVVGEVFVKLWSIKENFENIKSVKGFLYVSTRNACLNYLRRERILEEYEAASIYELTTEELTNDVIMNKIFDAEVLREVSRAIDTLPTQCRRILKMTMEGMNTNDIAAQLGLSAQTVRNTRVRATGMLKKQLSHNVLAVTFLAAVTEALMV